METILACTKEGVSYLRQAVQDGADLNALAEDGYSALYVCCKAGDLTAVKDLVGCGAMLDTADKNGYTALIMACKSNSYEVVEFMVDSGATVNLSNIHSYSPLYIAAENGFVDICSLLLERGADVNAGDKDGWTPLYVACHNGLLDVARLLIQHGAGVNAKDKNGFTALIGACENSHEDTAALLLEHGANDGFTAVLVASQNGLTHTAAALLQRGAVVNSKNKYGYTSLVAACENGHEATVTLLLSHGADLAANQVYCVPCCVKCKRDLFAHPIGTGDNGWTCDWSAHEGSNRFMNSDTVYGCANVLDECNWGICGFCWDRYLRAHNGMTPLYAASKNGHTGTAALLLHQGAEVNIANKVGMTALIASCERGHTECAELLINHGVDVNMQTQDGSSALYLACLGGYEATASLLIRHGADTHAKTKRDETIFSAAVKGGALAIVRTLAMSDLPCHPDGSDRADYSGTWTELVDPSKGVPPQVVVETVQEVLQMNPRLAYKLAHTRDVNSRTATSIAHPAVVAVFNKYLYFCGRYELFSGPPLHRSATAMVLYANDHGLVKEYEAAFREFAGCDHIYGYNNNVGNGVDGGVLDAQLFLECVRSLTVSSANKASDEELHRAFASCDADKDGVVSQDEFIRYCSTTYGRSRKVVIKFMRNEDQYRREKTMRENNDFDPAHIVNVLPGPSEAEFASAVQHHIFSQDPQQGSDLQCAQYKFGLVMPAADRSLEAIYRQERPGADHIRLMMKDLALALQHLHDRNVMHGDVKAANALRIQDKIALIDLDAAARFALPDMSCPATPLKQNAPHLDHSSFVGSKFSSGVLPPEMFCRLTAEQEKQYVAYWRAEKDANSDLWQKIRPVSVKEGGIKASYVVRTFAVASATTTEGRVGDSIACSDVVEAATSTAVLNPAALPYKLVFASPAIDVWSFGVVLYALCSGQPLLKVDRDDDICEPGELRRLLSWVTNKNSLDSDITNRVKDPVAANLLRMILQPVAEDRPASMAEILNHPFFNDLHANNAEIRSELDQIKEMSKIQMKILNEINDRTSLINARTIEMKEMSDKIFLQIRKSEQILLKGIFEATEVTVPTCFVILNQKLCAEALLSTAKAVTEGLATPQSQGKPPSSPAASGGTPKAENSPVNVAKETAETRAARTWIDKINALGAQVSTCATQTAGAVATSTTAFSAVIKNLIPPMHSEQKLYLYLVDEFNMRPVFDPSGVYPIEIRTPSDFVPKVLPLLKIGLNAVAAVNGVAGVVRCLGYPLPVIPYELIDRARDVVGKLNQTSSIAEYDLLQSHVADALSVISSELDNTAGNSVLAQESQQVLLREKLESRQLNARGAALRELERFFAQEDQNCHFSGLQRVCTPEGYSCWTLPENIEQMSAPRSESPLLVNVVNGEIEILPDETPALKDNLPPADSCNADAGGTALGTSAVCPPMSALSAAENVSLSANTVMQALMSAVHSEGYSQNAAASMQLQQSTKLFVSKTVGVEGALLRVSHNISVEIPAQAMAPGNTKEISVELLDVIERYAKLTVVSPILRITPCNYQFRRPVYVTLPHCVAHATKANIHITLFDSVYGVMRNSIDANAIEIGDQYVRFPVAFASDVVVSFRDPVHARHISCDCSNVHECQHGDCSVLLTGLRPRRRQCRYCDQAFCFEHCTHKLNNMFCCDNCYQHSWTLYMQAQCVAAWANSDILLTMNPCFDRSAAEKVLRCNFKNSVIKCNLQINLNEREFTLTALTNIKMSLKVPSVAVVMLSDASIKDQDPCEWRFNKYHEAPEMF